jgi:hypothetical protein
MTAYLFVGPTLGRTEVQDRAPGVVCLPPVAQGDVYRIAQRRPAAIGIVDGYFGGAPSVWHKEILWALSEGVAVFGSASMGALRAAELHSFGMRGVGRIFEAFRDGELEDDDEVALVHGPAEADFVALSVPMVNIRASLRRAQEAGELREASRLRLEDIAKSLFFPDRAWPTILRAADASGADSDELAALRRWLPDGCVDQKHDDAVEMLAAMQQAVARPVRQQPNFRFEWTHLWDDMIGRAPGEDASTGASSGVVAERLIDELRLEGPAAYEAAQSRALLRVFALREAAREGLQVSPAAMTAALAAMRERLRLFSRDDLDAWMKSHGLDEVSMQRLIMEEAQLRSIAVRSSHGLDTFLLDELRLSGAYERLAERARHKDHVLDDLRPDGVRSISGADALRLRMWFFEERLGRPMPDDFDEAARALGLQSAAELYRALWREWMYSRRHGQPDCTPAEG